MGLIITNINFNFPNGYTEPSDGVTVSHQFQETGFQLSGTATLTQDQYNATNGNFAQLTTTVANLIITNLGGTPPVPATAAAPTTSDPTTAPTTVS